MKPFMLFGSSMMIIVMQHSAVACIKKQFEIPEKHVEVVLLDIGHQLLPQQQILHPGCCQLRN